MNEYHKIEGIFVREEERPHKMLWGEYRNPVWKHLENTEWLFTEKVDGTNIRIYWDGHKVLFGGRTDNAQIPANLYRVLAELFDGIANEQVFEQKFGDTPVILFGEGYGHKIQKNGSLYASEPRFMLFDVNIGGLWLERESVEDIAKTFDCPVAPIAFRGTLPDAIAFAKIGFKSLLAEQELQAEGLVGTPLSNVLDRQGKRIIVKLKTHDLQTQVKDNHDDQ